MVYYVVKILVSAVLLTLIGEAAKRSTLLGGLLASLPLVSLLAFVWIYVETRDTARIAALSLSIFWLVLPSLLLFVLLPWLLHHRLPFPPALLLACLATAGAYYLLARVLKHFGVSL